MKKIVYLGSKDIGYACLKHLYDYRNSLDIEIVGVLTNPGGEKVIGFCRESWSKVD